MKYLPCILLFFLLACESEKTATQLDPPVFYEVGSRALKWKKVELPVVDPATNASTMEIVGYLKTMEYRVDQHKSVEYFDVVNNQFEFMGRISSQGKVSKFRINPYTRKAEEIEMGEHILEAGVAKVLNILGDKRYLMVITDLKITDTPQHINFMRKKRADTIAAQQKTKEAAEDSEEDSNE